MRPLTLSAKLDIQAAAAAGQAPRVSIIAYTGGVMPVAGWGPVAIDLAGLQIPASLPLLANHDTALQSIAGRGVPSIDGGKVSLAGTLTTKTEAGRDIASLAIDDGFEFQASVGVEPSKTEVISERKKVKLNGQTLTLERGTTIVRAGILKEVSIVALGADGATTVSIAASKRKKKMNENDTLETTEADDLLTAEENRLSEIDNLCDREWGEQATHMAGIKAAAVAGNVTLEYVKQEALKALRATRPHGPAIHERSRETHGGLEALQAGLMVRAGLKLDSPHWQTLGAVAIGVPEWLRMNINADARQRSMENGHRFARLSLHDLCREALRIDGKTVHNRTEMIQASFSGGSLSNIFTTNVAARLLQTFMEAADSTIGWTQEEDVLNFMTQERIQGQPGDSLNILPRGATADHAAPADRKETYKISRFAKQFQVDEQDIIDDRLNFLKETPKNLGLAAARLRPDLVYSILFANAALGTDSVALFHSSHANTDDAAALATGTLKTAVTKIGLQQDNGVNLNLDATHLVVPKTLQWTADELINSALIVLAGTAGSVTERGNANTLMSRLQVRSEARLDNGCTDPQTGTAYSGDTNDWFVAAAAGPTIEVGFLNGTGRVPTVRAFVLSQGQWGLGWDVKMDIGAKALGYRALYRGRG